ncbi:LacI family DNA-binding transcriptional regulator [Paenibacillus thalictri]|nr:LacI family DNA-binding transcriptional regulator [Paenibacillus thalictri]
MSKVTIKTLAELFQVTPKTVSKVLNHKPGVGEELRQSILRKAEELNYVPNVFGRGLQGNTMKTIGVVISDNASPNYSSIVKAIEAAADRAGYNMILCNSSENIEIEEKKIKLLIEKQVEGIIIAPVHREEAGEVHPLLKRLADLAIHYVLISRSPRDGGSHTVVRTDDEQGGYAAARYLIDCGHRRIAVLVHELPITPSTERLKGYRRAFAEAGVLWDERCIVTFPDATVECGKRAMLQALDHNEDCTAVLAFNDIIAMGAMIAARERGRRIPDDLAIVGFDDITYAQAMNPPLTTVRQDTALIGSRAFEVLHHKMTGLVKPTGQGKLILLQPELIIRETV